MRHGVMFSVARKKRRVFPESPAKRLTQQLERDRREQEDDGPVDADVPEHAPYVAVQLGEDKRREVPDLFLVRAGFAQAAAGEAAAHGEEQRDELVAEKGRDSHHEPDNRPRVRPCDQSGKKGALERQIGGVVVEQNARRDSRGQGYAKAERKQEALGPCPPLRDQNVTKPVVPHEDRGKRRDDRDLDDQGRQEKLIGRYEHLGSGILGKGELNKLWLTMFPAWLSGFSRIHGH